MENKDAVLMKSLSKKTRREAARRMALLRNKKASKRDVKKWASAAGKAAWASMTPNERRLEMRRRRLRGVLKRRENAQRAVERAKTVELYSEETEE